MNNYFISVVVPAYNEEKYLARSLTSLVEQDYPKEDFEVIVVDHDSTDATVEIAKRFSAKVVNCKEKGVSAARQTGYEAAAGEIFVGTDADTAVPVDWLSRINAYLQAHPGTIALTGSAKFDSKSPINRFMAEYLFPVTMETMFAFGKPALNGFNFAIRAGYFKKVGGFDKNLASAEDVDLGVRLAKEGKVDFISNLVVTTSSRRIDAGRVKFFSHHLRNIVKYMILGQKPEGFENIR